MRFLLAAALCLIAGCVSQSQIHARAHQTTVHLLWGQTSCSATIVGPHAILAATHCFHFGTVLTIYGQPVEIQGAMKDGNDHTIIFVDRTFPRWVTVDTTGNTDPGDAVFYFGNPMELTDQFRAGYLSGMFDNDGQLSDLYDIRCQEGDSGSGIFNDRGELIAVLSFIESLDTDAGELTFAGSYPLAFTAAQWARATQP